MLLFLKVSLQGPFAIPILHLRSLRLWEVGWPAKVRQRREGQALISQYLQSTLEACGLSLLPGCESLPVFSGSPIRRKFRSTTSCHVLADKITILTTTILCPTTAQPSPEKANSLPRLWWHPLNVRGAAAAKSLQSCPTLGYPTDSSPPGSTVPGILLARTLEWVSISCQFMQVKSESEVAQSFSTLSDPMDCSLPGSSVHGIFQARVLEWVAIAFSKRQS